MAFPAKKTEKFSTSEDDQPMVKFKVLLGESERASECDTFAMYKITDIPQGPAGS